MGGMHVEPGRQLQDKIEEGRKRWAGMQWQVDSRNQQAGRVRQVRKRQSGKLAERQQQW
jgi:predicted esterase YcpF (UPF0227 family)